MLRYPSLRAPLDILFLVCCIALTADVLVPEIWGSGKTKDYPLWFWAGQQVLRGSDLYPSVPFEFIYPPLSAILLASLHGAGGASHPTTPAIGEASRAIDADVPRLTVASAADANAAFRKLFIIAAVISSLAFLLALKVPDNRLDGPAKA